MGVWIETHNCRVGFGTKTSHPIWVCGLKHESTIGKQQSGPSHPIWVCGLKLLTFYSKLPVRCVTPYMGVWIETATSRGSCPFPRSHPIWVCGLKRECKRMLGRDGKVTPYMGVWIETCICKQFDQDVAVTPYMGVWIETCHRSTYL